jgi:hypothetical protein
MRLKCVLCGEDFVEKDQAIAMISLTAKAGLAYGPLDQVVSIEGAQVHMACVAQIPARIAANLNMQHEIRSRSPKK